MTKTREALLTRDQAAKYGQISVRTVDRMLSDGTLTRYRRRGRVFIDSTELDAALHPAPEWSRTT